MENSITDRGIRTSIVEAIMDGEGLFDIAERFGIRASEIIAATEAEVQRKCVDACRDQIIEAHRSGRIANPGGRPRVCRSGENSSRDRLIELSLRWQEKHNAAAIARSEKR